MHGYGQVWYYPESVANILSFSNIRKKFKGSNNTGQNDSSPYITATKNDGSPMHYQEISNRLYVYDAHNDLKIKDTKKNDYDYSLVSTIQHNENKFTSRKIKNLKLAVGLH